MITGCREIHFRAPNLTPPTSPEILNTRARDHSRLAGNPKTGLIEGTSTEWMNTMIGTHTSIMTTSNSVHTRTFNTLVGDQDTSNLSSDPIINTTMPTPIRSSPNNPPSPANHQRTGTGLPSVLLTNLQSFGMSEGKDKSTELEAVLNSNKIDIAYLTNLVNRYNKKPSFHEQLQSFFNGEKGNKAGFRRCVNSSTRKFYCQRARCKSARIH